VRITPFRAAITLGLTVGALTLSATSVSAAALPTVKIDPATAVADGATITVAIGNYPANTEVTAGLCAMPMLHISCDRETHLVITTDATGAGTGKIVVHKKYDGVDEQDKPNNKVDCGTVFAGCFVGAADAGKKTTGSTPIKFA